MPEKGIQYIYKALSQDGTIRLLLLHLRACSDSIMCDLSEVPLEQSPVDEVVSYVWAAPQHRESVITNPRTFSCVRKGRPFSWLAAERKRMDTLGWIVVKGGRIRV